MQQKNKVLRGSGAQTRNNTESFSFYKYIALQKENQKLKRRIREIGTESYEWMERALYLEAERDYYRDLARGEEEDTSDPFLTQCQICGGKHPFIGPNPDKALASEGVILCNECSKALIWVNGEPIVLIDALPQRERTNYD